MLSPVLGIGCTQMPQYDAAQADTPSEYCAFLRSADGLQLSFERVQLEERIDEIFGAIGDDAPGTAVLVLHEGRLVSQRLYGMASLELGVSFTPNHVVRLPYSEGREFVAIAAALMEMDGLVRLDDGVRGYFPELPAWSEVVAVRDLIHHHSGFVDEWSVLLLMHASMANRFETSQFTRLLSDQPAPEVEPGRGYMYSNSDYGLLRLILERVSGEDLGSYMQRRIFAPLEMNSTRLHDDVGAVIPHHAPSYAPSGDGYRLRDMKTSPGGAYAIATTACDLTRWAEAHAISGSEVSRAIDRLLDGADPVPGMPGHYAFGRTLVEVSGIGVVRHEGVLEANYLTRIPSSDYTVVTLTNGSYELGQNSGVVAFLVDPSGESTETRFPTEPIAAQDLERYTGRYVTTGQSWASEAGARELIRIAVGEAGLEVDWPLWGRLPLVPVGEGVFSWHDGSNADNFGMLLEFGAPDGGGPLELVVRYNDGFPPETFVRVEEWTPPSGLGRRVVGTYYSPYLDYSWNLIADEEGSLAVRGATIEDIPLVPYQPHEFVLQHERFPGVPSNSWVRFHENEAGEVTHLTVWSPRLLNPLNHRFVRR